MILADKILNLRKKSGLSQEELADKIGVIETKQFLNGKVLNLFLI